MVKKLAGILMKTIATIISWALILLVVAALIEIGTGRRQPSLINSVTLPAMVPVCIAIWNKRGSAGQKGFAWLVALSAYALVLLIVWIPLVFIFPENPPKPLFWSRPLYSMVPEIVAALAASWAVIRLLRSWGAHSRMQITP